MIWHRIIKKLHLQKAALKVLSPLCKAGKEMTMEEAEMFLQGVYPCHESTCLLEEPRKWEAPSVDLSILVPTYNNAVYIEESIHSALEQKTDYSFEIIVVNDGSTDDTKEKLNAFADCANVIIIHQSNGGVSSARNAALNRARGEYVLFLDGDDILLPDAVQSLMLEAKKIGAAVVEGGYQMMNLSGSPLETISHKAGVLDILKDLYGFPCFKAMKRSLWEKLQFPVGLCFEDSVLAQVLWEKMALEHEMAFGISKPVGGYRVNPSGFSMSSKARPCCVDAVWIAKTLLRDREKIGISYSQYYYEHLLDMAALSWVRTEYMEKNVRQAVFTMYRAFVHEKGFLTTQQRQKKIEQALYENNFALFELLCALS